MAANTVFSTYELVLLIAPYLDALSLVWVQGINHTFRNVIIETSSLRRRLGLKYNDKPPLSLNQVDAADCERVTWSPFLDWFSMRTLPNLEPEYGPLMSYNASGKGLLDYGCAVLILLPHAFHAGQNRASQVHNMYITNPPISSIKLMVAHRRRTKFNSRISLKSREIKSLHSSNGITIGAVIKGWIKLVNKSDRAVPICLQVSSSVLAEFTFTRAIRHTNEYIDANRAVVYCDRSQKRGQIMQKWYKRTLGESESWCEANMEEQSVFVREMLKEWKLATPRTGKRWTGVAAWPALALKGEEDKHKRVQCPYTVDFACGIVFNNANEGKTGGG